MQAPSKGDLTVSASTERLFGNLLHVDNWHEPRHCMESILLVAQAQNEAQNCEPYTMHDYALNKVYVPDAM